MTKPSTSDAAGAVLLPIEHDAAYDRYYIPMPGGWEIQTKGRGSTFRIANSITGERFAIIEQPYLFDNLERMAREIHAAALTPQPPPEAGSVGALQEWELLSMKFLAEALRKRGDDLSADAASWLEKFSAAPAPKESHEQ